MVLGRQGHDGVHVGHLSKEMDRDDGFRFSRDEGGGVNGIDIETDWADVAKNWSGSDPGDAASGGKEGKGGNQNFISRAYVQRHEGEEDRICAGGDAEIAGAAGERGAFLLEGRDVRSHDELATAEDPLEGGFQFAGERVVLGVDVQEGN
jgi:hypothetical protein